MQKTIPQQLADAQATVASLTTEKATLTTERDQAIAGRDSAVQAAVAPLNATIATLTTERDQARTDLATAQASIQAKDAEIATLKNTSTTAGQKAVEIAASQATKPVGEDKSKQPVVAKSRDELFADYRACTDYKQRAAIWAQIEAMDAKR